LLLQGNITLINASSLPPSYDLDIQSNQVLYTEASLWRHALLRATNTTTLVRPADVDIKIAELEKLREVAYKTAARDRYLWPVTTADPQADIPKPVPPRSAKKIQLERNEYIIDIVPGTGLMMTYCQTTTGGLVRHVQPFGPVQVFNLTLRCWDVNVGKEVGGVWLEYQLNGRFDGIIVLQPPREGVDSEGKSLVVFVMNSISDDPDPKT
jgi:hypothetical protein